MRSLHITTTEEGMGRRMPVINTQEGKKKLSAVTYRPCFC